MKIKTTFLLLLVLGVASETFAAADKADSERCLEKVIDMTALGDGCSGSDCRRKAFICLPRAWWAVSHSLPTETKTAPIVLAFHGKGKKTQANMADIAIWNKIKDAPEAGMFAIDTNLHGAMPNALVVYFQGLPIKSDWTPIQNNNFDRGWQVNINSTANSNRDLKFVYQFFNQYLRKYYQPNQLFAVGHSNGSRFVGVLWNRSSADLGGSPLKAIAFSAAQAGEFNKPIIDENGAPQIIHGDDLFDKSSKCSLFMGMGTQDITVPFNVQKLSIAKAKEKLQIPDDGVTKTQTLNNGELELQIYIHNEVAHNSDGSIKTPQDGHVWPTGQEQMIAQFFARQR